MDGKNINLNVKTLVKTEFKETCEFRRKEENKTGNRDKQMYIVRDSEFEEAHRGRVVRWV